jgi:hypothetical protein
MHLMRYRSIDQQNACAFLQASHSSISVQLLHTQQNAERANKRQRLTEALPQHAQQPLLTVAVPAALRNLLDTAGIVASLECVHEGYFRQC